MSNPYQQAAVAATEAARDQLPASPMEAPVPPAGNGESAEGAKKKKKGKKAQAGSGSSNQTEETQQQPMPQEDPVEAVRPIIYAIRRAEFCDWDNALTEQNAKVALGWETYTQWKKAVMMANPGIDSKTVDDEAEKSGFVALLKDEEGGKDGKGDSVRCLNNLDNRPYDDQWSKGLTQVILRFQWAGPITIGEEYTGTVADNVEPFSYDGVEYHPGDPITMRDGTVNGSTVVLSRTGRVESGQHSLTALVRACQLYRKGVRGTAEKNYEDGTYPEWDRTIAEWAAAGRRMRDGSALEGPVLETLLLTGISENAKVIMTVDNCKQRSEADVFYTSEMFTKYRQQPAKRKEMSRMLQACIDLFWTRTDAKGYRTHPEVMGVIERHPRLIKCIEHLFTENASVKRTMAVLVNGLVHDGFATVEEARRRAESLRLAGKANVTVAEDKLVGGRLISNLKLSAGQASALCYIMGCSASDGDEYRNQKPPCEKRGKEWALDWERWEKAKQFWGMLGGHADFEPVRLALGLLVQADENGTQRQNDPDNPGLGGRFVEKLAIIAKAWSVFITEERAFTQMDLEEGGCLYLHYTQPKWTEVEITDADGMKQIKRSYAAAELQEDAPDLGGIDVPERKKGDGEGKTKPMTKAEMEAKQEEARLANAREQAALIKNMRLEKAAAVPRTPTGESTKG